MAVFGDGDAVAFPAGSGGSCRWRDGSGSVLHRFPKCHARDSAAVRDIGPAHCTWPADRLVHRACRAKPGLHQPLRCRVHTRRLPGSLVRDRAGRPPGRCRGVAHSREGAPGRAGARRTGAGAAGAARLAVLLRREVPAAPGVGAGGRSAGPPRGLVRGPARAGVLGIQAGVDRGRPGRPRRSDLTAGPRAAGQPRDLTGVLHSLRGSATGNKLWASQVGSTNPARRRSLPRSRR